MNNQAQNRQQKEQSAIISTDDDTSVLIAVQWTKIFNRKQQNAI
jgi:hypothetical protein